MSEQPDQPSPPGRPPSGEEAIGQHRPQPAGPAPEVAELQRQLADSERQRAKANTEVAGLRLALEQALSTIRSMSAAAPPAGPAPEPVGTGSTSRISRAGGTTAAKQAGSNSSARRLTVGQRLAAAAGLVALGLVAVLVAALVGQRDQPRYVITGGVSTDPGDAKTLTACAALADQLRPDRAISLKTDAQAGLLALSLESTVPEKGLTAIEGLSQGIVTRVQAQQRLPATGPSASAAAEARGQRDRWRQRLAEIDRLLAAAATQPAGGSSLAEECVGLAAASRQALADRQGIASAIDALTARLNAADLDPSAIQMPSDRLQSAFAGDAMLQADMQALARYQAEMTTIIESMLQSAAALIPRLVEEAAAGAQLLATELQARHGDEVDAQLRVMRESLEHWSKAASELSEVWQAQQAALKTPDAQPLAIQASLAQAAKKFIEDTAAALNKYRKATEALGQGGDELTKRTVVRNRLSRDLQQVLDAREKLAIAVRRLVVTDNFELAAMSQRVEGLRRQVEAKRARIEGVLRNERLVELKAERERAMAADRAQREQLLRQAAELDKAIVEHMTSSQTLLARAHAEYSTLSSQIELLRERGDLLARIAALDQAAARRLAETSPPVAVHCIPAQSSEQVLPPGQRFWRAVIIALAPLLVCGAAFGLGWWFLAARRSTQAIEDYTRQLRARSVSADAPHASR